MAAEITLGAGLGFIAGLTGAGGAALALPGMIFLLGTPAVVAVATTFPFTAIMKVFGSYQHIRQGSVQWGVTTDLLLGTLPGAVAGIAGISLLVQQFGDAFDNALKIAIGALLLVSVLVSGIARRFAGVKPYAWPWHGRNLAGIGAGILCGMIIGATSVGGGSLLIVAMLLLYRLRPAEIVGTSILVSLALMILGTVGFWSEGLADLTLAWHLGVGAVPGVILGSMLTMRIPPVLLSRAVSLAVAAAGILLIIQGVGLVDLGNGH